MDKVIKSDYQNKYVLLALFKEVVLLSLKGLGFILKWMAVGWAVTTVLTSKPKKYDLLTKVVIGVSGLSLLRKTFRQRKTKKSIFKF
jgi:hypothetical protein